MKMTKVEILRRKAHLKQQAAYLLLQEAVSNASRIFDDVRKLENQANDIERNTNALSRICSPIQKID